MRCCELSAGARESVINYHESIEWIIAHRQIICAIAPNGAMIIAAIAMMRLDRAMVLASEAAAAAAVAASEALRAISLASEASRLASLAIESVSSSRDTRLASSHALPSIATSLSGGKEATFKRTDDSPIESKNASCFISNGLPERK